MFLADELFERTRAHTRGKRRPSICARKIDIFLFVEKVVHGRKYGSHAISASHFDQMLAGFPLVSFVGD
jgi:hypothetical protein